MQDDNGIKVTVAMAVFNAGSDLRLAVKSILNQSETRWELLLLDDGSTDHAIDDISDLLSDPRIKVLRDGLNRGHAKRLNEAINLARGQYFARMDQDDVSYPQRLAHQLAFLQAHPELDLVATRAILIDRDNHVIGLFPDAISHEEICIKPWRGFYFPHPTWMGKTSWFRKYRYLEPGPYLSEDQELLLRSYPASKFATLDQVLFAYRIRGHVPLGKIWRNRNAVLGVQLRMFRERRQFTYALLAVMVWTGRVIRDLLAALSGGSPPLSASGPFMMPSWEQVLVELQSAEIK